MKSSQNPWLKIPSSDYEGHMAMPGVGQLKALNRIFKDVLMRFSPYSTCVLGATDGNGFEHFILREGKILGIDINYKYLAECRAWFVEELKGLSLVCADLNSFELKKPEFDLVHAALIFEYVDVESLVHRIAGWLKTGGILSTVIQMPSDKHSEVSDTPYKSIKLLESFMKLVDVVWFEKLAARAGLNEIEKRIYPLESGKEFFVGIYKKEPRIKIGVPSV